MTEIYIFNRDDDLLTILTESNGLISAPFRDELNKTPDTPLEITVDAQVEYEQSYADGGSYGRQLTQVASMFIGAYGTSDTSEKVNVSPAQFVKEGNSVVFKDREGKLREYVIKEIDDIDNIGGTETTATCLPAFVDELNDNYVLDKRYSDQTPARAINDIVDGTRYIGEIDGTFGNASTNFYRMTSVEALYQMRDTWSGDVTDEVILDDNGRISDRKVILKQRLGADNGLRFEIDHNINEIQRTILSYPKTAVYGYGASLETEGGGNTRYIDFADVVWEKSSGDPADKPAGQTWVGDEDALQDSGIVDGSEFLHRYGKFSNQDYEDAEELLHATWQSLQEAKKPVVNYKLSVDLFNKRAVMGDTAIAIDREFARPIEIQTRIIAIEYDLIDIEGTTVVEMGSFLNLRDNRLDNIEEEINDNRGRWENPQIDNGSFPDIKPGKPTNVVATGAFQTIQIKWDYADDIYIASYEVYGSQVADFSPAEQHLLYRGKVSAFGHEVDTDQTWYYYIRAVNTHGTVSEFSERANASTRRLITDDILFGSITADLLADLAVTSEKIADDGVTRGKIADSAVNNNKLDDLAVTADKIAAGSVDTNKISQAAKDAINTVANQYTDQEVLDAHDAIMGIVIDKVDQSGYDDTIFDIMSDIADKADLQYVDGQLVDKVNVGDVYEKTYINDEFDKYIAEIDYSLDQDGVVTRFESAESRITQSETDITSKVEQSSFNSLTDDVGTIGTDLSQAETEIGQNATDITSKASTSAVNSLTGRVDTAESDISQNANAIESKVEQSEYNQKTGQLTSDLSTVTQTASGLVTTVGNIEGNVEDLDTDLSQTQTDITQNANAITLRATNTTVNAIDGRLDTAESEINVNAGEIDLRVEKNGIISAFNLSPESAKLEASKIDLVGDVSIVNGQTKIGLLAVGTAAIQDAAINSAKIDELAVDQTHIKDASIVEAKIAELAVGTAAIQNLAVTRGKLETAVIGTAQIENSAITNAKIKDLAVDSAKINDLDVTKLNAGTIDGNKIKLRGGSVTHFTSIDGNTIESRGQYTNTWFGETKSHDVSLLFNNGYIQAYDRTESQRLNYTAQGISTYIYGSNEDDDGLAGSGVIEFFSHMYSPTVRGLSLYSNRGTIGLKTATRDIIIDAARYVTIENDNLYTDKIRTKADSTNFYIGVSGDDDGELRVTNKLFWQGSHDDTRYMPIRSGGVHGKWFVSPHNFLYLGSDSGVRITSRGVNNLDPIIYRDVYAKGFQERSSREVKKNIIQSEKCGLDMVNNLNIVDFDYDQEDGENAKGFGIIAEESPEVSDGEFVNISDVMYANTLAIQELSQEIERLKELI